MLKSNVKYYLICSVLALCIGVFLAVSATSDPITNTPQPGFQLSPLALSFSLHSKTSLDGQLKPQHPRILLPELATLTATERVSFFQQRYNHFRQNKIAAYPRPCNQPQLSALTVCWLTTNDPHAFKLALHALVNLAVEKPRASSRYGNGWQLALNYDLLASSNNITPAQHQQIQTKLQNLLVDYLNLLDNSSASLWHGRLSLSSNAWLCAVMLDGDTDEQRQLIMRAQQYFLQSAQSAAITEAWPEGYLYWINNRALPFSLATAAYLNAVENSQHATNLKQLLERIGLWHIYATRPDNKIEGYGDEGPRIDLKDNSRRIIDLIASTTGNQQLALYSLYLQNLHGAASYYRHFRWSFPLFNNPALLPANATGALAEHTLPHTALFGRGASNALYVRSGWDQNATYLTYRAGHNFTHHGHYDAGHFTLFKGAPLAVNSSNYGKYTGENRLNYAIRTIAKNSLLVQRPNETVKPNQWFKKNVAAGGQRITLPTGSSIQSIQHWQDNLYKNQHLEGAELDHYTSNASFTFIQSDLTPAYNNTEYDENGNGGKVSRVQRSLLYLTAEDILLVRDQVKTTDPSYRVKWLLHSLNKPEVSEERVLKGSSENGILKSDSPLATIRAKNSSLTVTPLLPEDVRLHLIGGSAYRYYVEVDGDDQTLDGKNMSAGSNESAWFEKANWRTEIFSPAEKIRQDFLIALAPSINHPHPLKASLLRTSDNNQYGALLGTTAVVYTQSRGQFTVELPSAVKRLYLIGPLQSPRNIMMNGRPVLTATHTDSITQVLLLDSNLDKSLHIEL